MTDEEIKHKMILNMGYEFGLLTTRETMIVDRVIESMQKEKEKENEQLKDDKMVMADNYSKMEQKFFNELSEKDTEIDTLKKEKKDICRRTSKQIIEQEISINELKAQIEKMKCCQNCVDGKSCENSGLVYVCNKWRFEK